VSFPTDPWLWAGATLLALAGLVVGFALSRRAPSIMSADGRRAWAFAAIVGGCVVFTGFAAAAVWQLRAQPFYLLVLGLAAHVQILVGMTALGWTLGRRLQLDVNKRGARMSDRAAPLAAASDDEALLDPPPGAEEGGE
jgi:lysylphosphatidylglycerol synthetase-like protein (DUF2156 family)